MKIIYCLILFAIVSSISLKERAQKILENKDFLIQAKDVVNSFKSKNITNIVSTLNDTLDKIKNGAYPCFFFPCEVCKDLENYKICQNTCWSGFFCDTDCLKECKKYC